MASPITDSAIVLRQWEYSETSQTVCLLCRTHGMLRGLAKGSKRERAPFSGGIEPLTLGEVVAHPKRSDALAIVASWDLREVFWSVRRDLWAFRAGCYMADIVGQMLVDQDPHPQLFDALVRELRALGAPGGVWGAVLRFQWSLLVECGYRPRLGEAEANPGGALGFDPAAGSVTEDPVGRAGSAGAWRVRTETIEVLRRLERAEPGRSADRRRLERACRLMAAYLGYVLGKRVVSESALFGDRLQMKQVRDEG